MILLASLVLKAGVLEIEALKADKFPTSAESGTIVVIIFGTVIAFTVVANIITTVVSFLI